MFGIKWKVNDWRLIKYQTLLWKIILEMFFKGAKGPIFAFLSQKLLPILGFTSINKHLNHYFYIIFDPLLFLQNEKGIFEMAQCVCVWREHRVHTFLIGLLTFHWPIAHNLAYLLHDNIRQTFWLACLLTYFHNICWHYIRHFVFASSTQKGSCRRQLSSQLPQAALYSAAVGSYLQLPQAALFSISPTWEYNHYCSMSMYSRTSL